MMQIAAVGSDAFIIGFRLAGIDNVFSATVDNIESTLKSVMSDQRFGIIVVHNDEVRHISGATKDMMLQSIKPVLIQIGGEEGELRRKVKATIGVDLYKTS